MHYIRIWGVSWKVVFFSDYTYNNISHHPYISSIITDYFFQSEQLIKQKINRKKIKEWQHQSTQPK